MTRVATETERETVDRLVQRTVFTPVRGAGAVAETVARLGEAIGLGLLKPGDRLPSEMQLASALGISAVSLRSALVVLRSAGLIETRRGRGGGTFITPGAAQALRLRGNVLGLMGHTEQARPHRATAYPDSRPGHVMWSCDPS